MRSYECHYSTRLAHGLIGCSNTTKLIINHAADFFEGDFDSVGRLSNLIHALKTKYGRCREGSPTLRQQRMNRMESVTHDLSKYHVMPMDWHHLHVDQIKILVKEWKNTGWSHSTMMNDLAVLRHFAQFMKLPIAIPSNKALGLTRQPKTGAVTAELMSRIQDIKVPEVKLIFGAEIYLGLTKREAMSCIPQLNFDLKAKQVIVMRKIAFNHQERRVPIVGKEQEELIDDWYKMVAADRCLLDSMAYHDLITLYRIELKRLGLSSNIQYRQLYLSYRMTQLLEEDSEFIKILSAELGVSLSQVRKYMQDFKHYMESDNNNEQNETQ